MPAIDTLHSMYIIFTAVGIANGMIRVWIEIS